MAWSDFPSLVAGTSQMQLSHFNDIRSALIERCDWVGDSTQKTAAQGLSTTNPFNPTWLIAARDIVQALCTQYVRPGTAYAVSNLYGKWSVVSMKTYLQQTYGETSGFGYINPNYNWILRPTRKTSLILGKDMPASTYHPYLEHIMGLWYAIDKCLRWIPTHNPTSSPETYRWVRKEEGYNHSTAAAAWAAMKALGGTISNSAGGSSDCGVGQALLYGWYNANDYRILFPVQVSNTWLVAPTGYDEIRFMGKTLAGETDLGPYCLKTNVTNSAAGAYSTGSAFDAAFTFSAANTLEEFTVDNPDNHPKVTSTVYVLMYDTIYDGAAPGAPTDTKCALYAANNMNFAFKPTTSYGT